MERQKQGRAPAYRLIRLAEGPAMLEPAARWFHEKWGVPEEEYRRSMAAAHCRGLDRHADDCVQCGHCDRRCPFGVVQTARMREIAACFG